MGGGWSSGMGWMYGIGGRENGGGAVREGETWMRWCVEGGVGRRGYEVRSGLGAGGAERSGRG